MSETAESSIFFSTVTWTFVKHDVEKNMMLIKMRANVDKNVQHHYESCGARLNVIRFWGMIASDITDDITIIIMR